MDPEEAAIGQLKYVVGVVVLTGSAFSMMHEVMPGAKSFFYELSSRSLYMSDIPTYVVLSASARRADFQVKVNKDRAQTV